MTTSTPISDAAATDDHRATLVELRTKLAAALDKTTSGRDIAALSKRMSEVLDEIAALDADAPASDESPLGKLLRQRADKAARAAAIDLDARRKPRVINDV